MADVYLSLNPANLPETVPMNVGDKLYITVAASCSWCYTDTGGIFPSQGSTGCLPAPNSYTLKNPPQVFAAAVPTKAGDVPFNAVTAPPCDPGAGGARGNLGHIIHVS